MLRDVCLSVGWVKSLSVKFFRVVPYSTSAILLLTLVSQVAALLASFLPLKVVIMLGSDGIPRYFPPSFSSLDRDVLIATLSAGTVGFYLLHLVAERMVSLLTSVATSRLLRKSQKMVLFENQEELAASSYQRYSRALAGGVFIFLALLGLGWFYHWMATVIASYFLWVMLLFWGLHRKSQLFRVRLETKLSQTLNLAGGIGFFFAFGFLVADFIFWSPPGVIIAIVSLLLSRQVMQRATGMVGDLTSLRRQQAKLDALFFHGKVLLPQQESQEKTLWPLLAPDRRKVWISEILQEMVGMEKQGLECHWHQLGTPNIFGLRVIDGDHQYLIKLFEVNRTSWALHEASLMTESASRLPALRWIGAAQVQKFHCLVYELFQGEKPVISKVRECSDQLRENLLVAQPHADTISRYIRSKAMLWQRLECSLLERLRVAAQTAGQQVTLSSFFEQLPYLQHLLKELPLVLHNPDLIQDAIWIPVAETGQDKAPVLVNWGRWSLEPVGAGWPEAEKALANLGPSMLSASEERPELATVRAEQAELAALAFALELECNRQRYVQAFEFLPRMLERMAILESSEQQGMVNAK